MRHNKLLQPSNVCWKHRSLIHIAAPRLRQYQLNTTALSSNGLSPHLLPHKSVRKRYQEWQQAHGNPLTELLAIDHADALNIDSDWRRLGNRADGVQDEDMSNQDMNTDMDTSAYELSYARRVVFEPGDLVELSPQEGDSSPPLGVYVRTFGFAEMQIITPRGQWQNVFGSRVMSAIPAFVDPILIDPILPFLPSKAMAEMVLEQGAKIDIAAPREVTGPVVSALARIKSQADEIYRHNAAILDSAHDILAHPTDLRFGGVHNIADKLLGTGPKPTWAQIYAVRKAIHYAGIGFHRDSHSHRTTGLYQIRSKEFMQQTHLARGWLREYQEAQVTSSIRPAGRWQEQEGNGQVSEGAAIVQGFVDKCRQRILKSRQTRQPTATGIIGPSSERYPYTAKNGAFYTTEMEPVFTEREVILVKFIESWTVQNHFHHDKSLRALAPLILRATGMYEGYELKGFAAYLFLQEIGVYDPWANPWLFDVNLLLPTSQHSKPLERLATELKRMTSRDVNMKDSMAHLRHDWKDLQAYAIDSAGSKEIDDAISVQRIEGSSTDFWVHIHIANPTAFMERNDVFSKMAMHLTETLYMPELVYPLLPSWMTQEKFSLKANRPCLTFSTRIDLNGDVKETKIQPGILRKVISLEYDHLPEILGTSAGNGGHTWSLVVGGPAPQHAPSPLPNLSSEQVDDLKLLHKIAQGFAAFRERNGAIFYTPSSSDCSVYWKDVSGLPAPFPHRKTGIITHGDPIIQLRGRKFVNPFSFSTRSSHFVLVQEMMTSANYAAASWCDDRKVPLLYRGTGSKTRDEFDAGKELLHPAIKEHGFVPMAVGAEFVGLQGRAVLAPEPVKHRLMGLSKYTKLTSPLRRYGDMMAHWQIEAAIREEARKGEGSLIGASTSDHALYLPYSRAHVEKMLTRVEPREQMIKRMKKRADEFWMCLAFQRAIDFGEAPLPRRAEVVIIILGVHAGTAKLAQAFCGGRLVESSFAVRIAAMGDPEAAKRMLELRPGDVWDCEYVAATPRDGCVFFRPIRLLRKELDKD